MTTAPKELVAGIWSRDPTLWTGTDEARWLGWLDEPQRMLEELDTISALAESVRSELDTVVLLGMGGSSLAPEVLRRWFEAPNLHVLDTTHPGAVRALGAAIDLERTCFVASSKSGGTLETRSHLEYFWQLAPRGSQWLAVTDPGTELERLAASRHFRMVVAGEPTIGGRYSALSPFGVVPAALVGVELERFLLAGCEMADACRAGEDNPGLALGLALGSAWAEGRDKVCVPLSNGFELWVEQLLAESTGKHGKGLVPAPGEPAEGGDRQAHGFRLADAYDLPREFFRWEFATAVAATTLGINPFDQPDVQAAKDRTNEVLAAGVRRLEPESSPEELFALANPGDYVCIQAFVEPGAETERRLELLRQRAREATGCVVTLGYGPRYLHSTGQLHKGGPNTGLFLQVFEDYGAELPIPGRDFGFRELIEAQATGDFESLRERGRRVARVRLEELD